MLSDAMKFWESIAGKVKQLIRGETQNAFRCERYEVSTAPNGTVMGVKKPYGNEILLPYSKEVSEASVGDPVLVVWWNSMSNAKVYYFANGYEGTTGGGGGGDPEVVIATITFPLSWNNSGSGYYTVTPTISGATVSAVGKVDLQPTQAQTLQLQSDGVTALYVENNGGVLTAYAIGAAPTTAMTMQCTVTGVTSVSPVNPYLDMIYPVGAIYMSVSSASPASLFGGTWEQIQDMFLLAAGTTYAAGATGGEAEHTLTVDEMPSHSHAETIGRDGNNYFKPVAGNAIQLSNNTVTGSTGGGQAHNNMPPYLAVYVWKRTA